MMHFWSHQWLPHILDARYSPTDVKKIKLKCKLHPLNRQEIMLIWFYAIFSCIQIMISFAWLLKKESYLQDFRLWFRFNAYLWLIRQFVGIQMNSTGFTQINNLHIFAQNVPISSTMQSNNDNLRKYWLLRFKWEKNISNF